MFTTSFYPSLHISPPSPFLFHYNLFIHFIFWSSHHHTVECRIGVYHAIWTVLQGDLAFKTSTSVIFPVIVFRGKPQTQKNSHNISCLLMYWSFLNITIQHPARSITNNGSWFNVSVMPVHTLHKLCAQFNNANVQNSDNWHF